MTQEKIGVDSARKDGSVVIDDDEKEIDRFMQEGLGARWETYPFVKRRFFHATTKLNRVLEEGLKDRDERRRDEIRKLVKIGADEHDIERIRLGMSPFGGLGGGEEHTVSVTESMADAENIVDMFRDIAAICSGEMSVGDIDNKVLKKLAPPDKIRETRRALLIAKSSYNDRYPTPIEFVARRKKGEYLSNPIPMDELPAGELCFDVWSDYPETGKNSCVAVLRNMKEDEYKSNLLDYYSWVRWKLMSAGIVPDPLLFGTGECKRFANIDPGIVEVISRAKKSEGRGEHLKEVIFKPEDLAVLRPKKQLEDSQ